MKIFKSLLGVLIAVGSMSLTGCGPRDAPTTAAHHDTSSEATVDRASLTAAQRAADAKDDLLRQLSSKLIAAMSAGGPTAAIEVCSQKAAEIATRVGESHRVAIGRTSFKLRNSDNAPPNWAQPLVERREAESQFIDLPEGGTGALFPIRLQTQCLVCHGSQEQIAQDVQRLLKERYPEDTATGFAEGDLRGWCWVEVHAD